MTSAEESWRISKIANEARRRIESLDVETQERILLELESIQDYPSRSIEILLFEHRGAIKNKTIQRL